MFSVCAEQTKDWPRTTINYRVSTTDSISWIFHSFHFTQILSLKLSCLRHSWQSNMRESSWIGNWKLIDRRANDVRDDVCWVNFDMCVPSYSTLWTEILNKNDENQNHSHLHILVQLRNGKYWYLWRLTNLRSNDFVHRQWVSFTSNEEQGRVYMEVMSTSRLRLNIYLNVCWNFTYT